MSSAVSSPSGDSPGESASSESPPPSGRVPFQLATVRHLLEVGVNPASIITMEETKNWILAEGENNIVYL